jgi:hypothetical protein
MTKLGIGSKVAVIVSFAALCGVLGCADFQDVDQTAGDEVLSHDDVASEVAAQQAQAASPNARSAANIAVASMAASGAGCPKGSWSVDRVPEGNAFTISFNSYVIEAPPTTTPTTKSLSCIFNIQLRTPKNLSYAVTHIQYFGYANLSAGMRANLVANYLFTGGGRPVVQDFRHDFPVPSEGSYAVNDQITRRGTSLSWAPCDITNNLQVRTRLTIDSIYHGRPGLLSLDNIDGRTEAGLKIVLQTGDCPSDR